MKIGILTYPLNNNYGCYLQSYALLTFLKEKGYNAEYIYRRHDKPSFVFYLKYAVKKIINRQWHDIIYDYEKDYMLEKGLIMYPFFKNNIVPHTAPIYTSHALAKLCSHYDVVIVGSDQVWRAEILTNIGDYFLDFAKTEKPIRISYAASFGKDEPNFTKKQKEICGKALTKFKAVSLREDSGVNTIRRYGWKIANCRVVLDPTMLLCKDHYLSLLQDKGADHSVFGYILDQTESKLNILDTVSKMVGAESLNILKWCNKVSFEYPPVQEWLSVINNAIFVVTDSFHGAVFSILFNKPFAIIINKERGAVRFDTLLNTFNLRSRIVESPDDISGVLNNPIDWDEVNAVLEKKRKESADFLLSALENN